MKESSVMHLHRVVALAAIIPVFATTGRAVLVFDGDNAPSAANAMAPADDPGWANAGSGFVYLGSFSTGYWVLSATHVVGNGDNRILNINGTNYSSINGSGIRLTNADSSLTDLTMFRVAGDAALDLLPDLNIRSAPISTGDTVRFIGTGQDRASTRTYWSVNTTSWTWSAGSSSPAGANAQGYTLFGGGTKRWGDNTVSDINQSVNIGNGPTSAFGTTFNGVSGSAMLAVGDSGGAAFIKNSVTGEWELAGINDAVGKYNNQPDNTAVVGNKSYAADLSVYRSQILAAVPEPSEYGLMAGGVAFAVVARRRFRKRAA